MKKLLASSFIILNMLFAVSVSANDLRVIAEDNAPFSFEVNGQVIGFATDMLLEVFNRADMNVSREDIHIRPWARGYADIQHHDNVILFPMNKIPKRVGLFQWIGPIVILEQALLVKRDRNIHMANLAMEIPKHRIATIRSGAAEQYLLSKGVFASDLRQINDIETGIKMLKADRVDGFFVNTLSAFHTIKKLNLNPHDYEFSQTLFSAEIYYAASKNMNPTTVSKLQKALNQLKKDGTAHAILKQYR